MDYLKEDMLLRLSRRSLLSLTPFADRYLLLTILADLLSWLKCQAVVSTFTFMDLHHAHHTHK